MNLVAIAAGLGVVAILATNFVRGWQSRDPKMRKLGDQVSEEAVSTERSERTIKDRSAITPEIQIPWKRTFRNPTPVEIGYIDRAGKETRRIIVPHAVLGTEQSGRATPEQIAAYCKKAKAARTFNIPQIVQIVDQETGEILDAASWIAAHIKQ